MVILIAPFRLSVTVVPLVLAIVIKKVSSVSGMTSSVSVTLNVEHKKTGVIETENIPGKPATSLSVAVSMVNSNARFSERAKIIKTLFD